MGRPTIYVVTKSPGRREALERLGFRFEYLGIDTPETVLKDPIETVLMNSILKSKEAAKIVDGYILTFDTVVYIDGEILGKPKSRDEAISMLEKLSGRGHCVYTGIALHTGEEIETDYGEARVWFRELEKREIEWHVEREEYWRYAGGYRIQGLASLFVERIEGDYYTVVGIPLAKMITMLRKAGVEPLEYIE